MFQFIITFFSKSSQTCVRKKATKAVLISLGSILLLAKSFCIYQAHTENKVGHESKIRSQCPCENEWKMFCLNGGECCFLIDEDIIGCDVAWLFGGKRCEKYMCWDWIGL